MNMFKCAIVLASLTILGCGRNSTTELATPNGASDSIAQTLKMIQDASYGGTKLASAKDTEQYQSLYPEAVQAIKDGKIIVLWGKTVKDNAKDAQIIAYEAAASSGEGWGVKEDGQLHKVTSEEVSKLSKSTKSR